MKKRFKSRESLYAPEKLGEQEIQKIVEKVNDERLRIDQHGEYFTLHLKNKVVSIPKRRRIDIRDESGSIKSIKTEEYIRNYLDEYDENEKNGE